MKRFLAAAALLALAVSANAGPSPQAGIYDVTNWVGAPATGSTGCISPPLAGGKISYQGLTASTLKYWYPLGASVPEVLKWVFTVTKGIGTAKPSGTFTITALPGGSIGSGTWTGALVPGDGHSFTAQITVTYSDCADEPFNLALIRTGG
jgi:hypothetical protein